MKHDDAAAVADQPSPSGPEPTDTDTDTDPVLSVTELALMPALSHAVRTCVELDIFEQLIDGPLTVSELAGRTGVVPRRLRQVLRAVASTGLLTGGAGDVFALTPSGRVLLRDHPSASRDLLLTQMSPLFQGSLSRLEDSLRSDRSGVAITEGREVFDYYADHPDEYASFSAMMRAYLGEGPTVVAQSYSFPAGSTVIDCGGGIGTQLVEILLRHTGTTGVLFDTPAVIDQARSAAVTTKAGPALTAVAGDFFVAVPAGGDHYLLSHIIHDWDDEQAVRILRNCRAAAAPGARFLLIEELVPPGDDRSVVKMLDVVLSSVFNGGQRTLEEVDALLAAAGMRRTQAREISGGLSLVEAVAKDDEHR